jgi:hypothetical protein
MAFKRQPKAFASFDIETDGNNPCQHSMLALGIVLFSEDGKELTSWERHIGALPYRSQERKCMVDFWANQPEAWQYIHTGVVSAEVAMKDLADWIGYYSKIYRLQWLASPSCFDWMFVKCYYEQFGPEGKPDIGYFCHDAGAQIRGICDAKKIKFEDKKKLEQAFTKGLPYTHCPVDDARFQGAKYFGFLNVARS